MDSRPRKQRPNSAKLIVFFGLLSGLSGFAPTFSVAQTQPTQFGVNLSGGKEPVELNADDLEMRDKEGVAIFTGNVSVVQGDRVLRTSKLVVHYGQNPTASADKDAISSAKTRGGGLGSTGVEKMEASGKVYIKTATQVATGDEGVFDGQSKIMTLTGQKVILTDGDNVATGCKLVAHMDTGRASLQSCAGNHGRVSIIMNNKN